MRFKFYKQLNTKDCGPTCLKMILKHYGVTVPIGTLREYCETTRSGSNLNAIAEAAERIGLRTLGANITSTILYAEQPLPCIAHWRGNHFIIVYKITGKHVHVADPGIGLIKYSKTEFEEGWIPQNTAAETGIVLLFERTSLLTSTESDELSENQLGWRYLFTLAFQHKKLISQIGLSLAAASLLQLIVPFFTQGIVDIGIRNQNIEFIYLILICQIVVFIGKSATEVVRGWFSLYLSTRINISLVAEFFIKLMQLPMSYFDNRLTGDIMQRIIDHKRIENLVTTSTLNVLFSGINFIIFAIVLSWYNLQIFIAFLIGSAVYFGWVQIFMKYRKKLDYKRFSRMSQEQSKIIELINGMQEIKLHNAERQKRWGWEHLQVKLFKIRTETLTLEQSQNIGSSLINELKNMLITAMSALFVIKGEITLGMMMAISYIIGQLNGPVVQFISFRYAVQDARIALERLQEIHETPNEDKANAISHISGYLCPITIAGLSFRYPGNPRSVLENLSLTIPAGKITAIVGSSGSGKTTLMKILLKYYQPKEGVINYGHTDISKFNSTEWRRLCGVVLQEGYIFDDSIAGNITLGAEKIDEEQLQNAIRISNIDEFLVRLPHGIHTILGSEGISLSTGQKQRIQIARAVYKNPKILFFDEATSSLDSENEKQIMANLDTYLRGRTSIIIAHRLSTVKTADQIIVLENGRVCEIGHHQSLIEKKGHYYRLVKNQLDLENAGS